MRLRAFTPDDAKALKATASTFPRSSYDLEEVLTQLGIGEAVITVLSERGAPTPVAWTMLRAPQGSMSPLDAAQMTAAVAASPLAAEYGQQIDRESAYERLAAKLAPPPAAPEEPPPPPSEPRRREAEDPGLLDNPVFKTVATAAAATLGREIVRGIFGTRRRRRR